MNTSSTTATITTYADVPLYRKNWFAIVCFFIFAPALLLVLLTGDVYYEKNSELKKYSKLAKILLLLWSAGMTIKLAKSVIAG